MLLFKLLNRTPLHHITLETIHSGLSESNIKDHCGDAAKEQCLGMIAEINVFPVSDEMLWMLDADEDCDINTD